MTIMSVYKITNKITGKSYVGQTAGDIYTRFKKHCYPSNSTKCILIGRAIQKYGRENFIVELLDVAADRDDLNKKEVHHIQAQSSLYPGGYNLQTGGGACEMHEETKLKLSDQMSGRRKKPDRTENPRQYNTYKPKDGVYQASEETRKRISEARKRIINTKGRPVIGTHMDTGDTIYLEKMNGDFRFNPTLIRYCCRGQRRTHRRYYWRYVDESDL